MNMTGDFGEYNNTHQVVDQRVVNSSGELLVLKKSSELNAHIVDQGSEILDMESQMDFSDKGEKTED